MGHILWVDPHTVLCVLYCPITINGAHFAGGPPHSAMCVVSLCPITINGAHFVGGPPHSSMCFVLLCPITINGAFFSTFHVFSFTEEEKSKNHSRMYICMHIHTYACMHINTDVCICLHAHSCMNTYTPSTLLLKFCFVERPSGDES